MTIFKTLSNLNHDGHLYKAGDLFEGELETFSQLVNDGVLVAVEGAESIAEAEEVLNKVAEEETEVEEKEVQAQDTWAPEKNDEDTWGPKENKQDGEELKSEEVNTETKVEESETKKEGEPEVNGDNL